MPTLLDNELEVHEGPEPRVMTADVQAVLRRVIRPGDDGGAAVSSIADRARVSTRTVYRVLNPDESKETISLDLADRLCLACGVHIAFACPRLNAGGIALRSRARLSSPSPPSTLAFRVPTPCEATAVRPRGRRPFPG